MEIIGKDIYVTLDQVCQACGMTHASLCELISRGSVHWQTIKAPTDARRKLILYKTLLPKYQTQLRDLYTQGLEPATWLAQKPEKIESSIVDFVLSAYEDFAGFLRYYQTVTAADERKTQKARKYLARAASCMSAIHIYYSQNNISPSNRKPLIEVSEYLMEEKDRLWPKPYGYMKCSVRHIQESLKQLQEGASIDDVITQPRVGNENRLGEGHSFIKGAVARMLTSGKNPTVADVVRKVQYLCTIEGLGKPSESSIYKYVGDMRSIISLQRFGDANKASQNQRFSIPTARAMFAGDCWEMDGTRVQIQPFRAPSPAERAGGEVLQYLYIVAVRDVYSGAYMGWSFGLSESGLMYREALKMAVSLSGYLPFELRHDKFPGHNSDDIERLFESLTNRGVKLTKTSSATGKAHVERAFGTLQSVFESDRREWVGQGIKSSRPYARPTAEYLAKTHKQLKAEGFTWEEAWRVENEVMMTYNCTPYAIYSKKYKAIDQSPLELHDQDTERPNVINIETYDIADLFWATRKITIRNYAVNIEVNRQQHTYMLTDEKYYEIVRNHNAVLVKFDASDMSEVMLFDALYNTYLNSVEIFQNIQMYGAAPEYDRLAEEKAKQKALKQHLASELQEVQSHCDGDILSIQIAHLLPKQNAEMAESSAMANYWRNTIPVQTQCIASPTKKRSQATTKRSEATTKRSEATKTLTYSNDPLADILNQL